MASARLARPPTTSTVARSGDALDQVPGVAIKLSSQITTEIYESVFILPGIVSPGQLYDALCEVVALSEK